MENGQEKEIQLSFSRHVICWNSSVKVIKGQLFLRVPLKWRKRGKKRGPRQFSTSYMPMPMPGSKTKEGPDTWLTFSWLPPFDFKVNFPVLRCGLFLWQLSHKVHCKRNTCFLLTTAIVVWGTRRQKTLIRNLLYGSALSAITNTYDWVWWGTPMLEKFWFQVIANKHSNQCI